MKTLGSKIISTVVFLAFWLNVALIAHVVHMYLFALSGGEIGQTPFLMAALACVGPPLGIIALVALALEHDQQARSRQSADAE
jgi:hypothetical protein